jgi:hypothetical protein
MDSTWYPFVLALIVFGGLGLQMVIRPGPIVRIYQKSAARDRSPLGGFNRKVFDPSRAKKVAGTFRLIGALWLLLVATAAALLWANV